MKQVNTNKASKRGEDRGWHGQYEYRPVQTLSKYFEDGRIELWLTNDEGDELYLIESGQSPTGRSPIVEMKPLKAKETQL